VLAPDLDALGATLGDVDGLCSAAGVSHALLSDGIRWRAHRLGSRRSRRVWDLATSLDGPAALEHLLTDLAEGI
jgi:hypothetical protein